MTTPDTTGKALTVLGPVAPHDLGVTLTHEHLLIDLSIVFVEPDSEEGRRLAEEPVAIDNLGWLRTNWSSNRDNLVQTDIGLATREAARYKAAGGGTLVDVTSVGIDRNPKALAEISRATGVNVVMGASPPAIPKQPWQR